MNANEPQNEMNEYVPDGWENCLEEIECFIFGKSRLATRYNDRELIAALCYLGRSLVWKRKNPGREDEWIGSPAWESAMTISQLFLDNQK